MRYLSLLSAVALLLQICSCKKDKPDVHVQSIMLSKDTLNIIVGNQAAFTASASPLDAPDTALTYTSANPLVATVKKPGLVTAIAIGQTTITVSNSDNTASKKCVVNVLPVAVSGITLNKDSTAILLGNTDTLKATVLPVNASYGTVTWASSDNTVAKVSAAGVITTVASGEATIIASSQDGSQKAACKVVVGDMNYFVSGIGDYYFSTSNGQDGESVGFNLFNNSRYPVTITSWELHSLIDVPLVTTKGPFVAQPGTGYNSIFVFTSFAQNNLSDHPADFYYFPVVVYFTCQAKNYQLVLTWIDNANGKPTLVSQVTAL